MLTNLEPLNMQMKNLPTPMSCSLSIKLNQIFKAITRCVCPLPTYSHTFDQDPAWTHLHPAKIPFLHFFQVYIRMNYLKGEIQKLVDSTTCTLCEIWSLTKDFQQPKNLFIYWVTTPGLHPFSKF